MGGRNGMEEHYWLAGKVNIPENKKQEFNACVMEILNLCGIRKRKSITLADKTVTVLDKPQADQNGIVSFDYSIFEKKNRDASTYDSNTCELHTVDRGVGEFGLAMNLILLLQECYSNGSCYFMVNRRLVYVPAYMDLLCTLLNRKITINSRAKIWDIMLFMRGNHECDMPEGWKVFQDLPWEYCKLDHLQLQGVFASERVEINDPGSERINNRTQITNATRVARNDYLNRIMTEEYQKSQSELTRFLKVLLDSPLSDRTKWALEQNNYGIIADISLYLHPADIVSVLALLKGESFWDVWDSLQVQGYKDVKGKAPIKSEPSKNAEWGRRDFYKQIMRDDQDEFLEFWDGENLILSDSLQNRITEWKKLFEKTADMPDLDAPQYLADILYDMEHDWKCRYVDSALVDDTLEHRDDPMRRKALLLLRRVMDGDMKHYPELDRKMAILWIKSYRFQSEIEETAALCSLLTNQKQRKQLFGY